MLKHVSNWSSAGIVGQLRSLNQRGYTRDTVFTRDSPIRYSIEFCVGHEQGGGGCYFLRATHCTVRTTG